MVSRTETKVEIRVKSPVPDTRELYSAGSEVAGARLALNLDLESQLGIVAKISAYSAELANIPEKTQEGRFHWRNPAFGPYDAATYYCMARHFQPRRIIEIGAGYSSLIAVEAAGRNGATEITCVDPYPHDFLKSSVSVKLLPKQIQSVELGTFTNLQDGDFLFVDSSHMSKIGSDMNDIIFRILPAVSNGVLIHFHDIFLPFDYPANWVKKRGIFYNEQYLLLALLMFNPCFEVVLANQFLCRTSGDELRRAFPDVPNGPVGGSSFWMRRSG